MFSVETLSTSISVYRGKFGILEHTIAGATSGLLYKFFAGPRAWIVGCGLGAALGTFAGCISYGLLTLTGTSWEEIRYWQYNWKESRSALIKKSIEKQNEKDELLIQHDEKMKELGKTLSDIDVDADDKKASIAK
ncbi:c3orf1 protein-related [Holotrichia oblita]|uniref:C3orf1 protein-related n=1 Tax=Holotrichia oblita TaxID=644536 RepID=A0ACB9T576_HOLOL|nr:c3orf1 protein-related [Holotrichia oblita]